MTDRRVGSTGLNVDIVPTPTQRVGSVGLHADVVPATSQRVAFVGLNVEIVDAPAHTPGTETRTGSAHLTVDLQRTATVERQTGSLGVNVDLQRTTIPERRTGSLGLMVDLRSAPTTTPPVPAWIPAQTLGYTAALFEELGFPTTDASTAAKKWFGEPGAPVVPIEVVVWAATQFDEALTGPGTTAVRWTGTHFEEAGTDPLVQWDGSAFVPHAE